MRGESVGVTGPALASPVLDRISLRPPALSSQLAVHRSPDPRPDLFLQMGGHCACGGGCPKCAQEVSHQAKAFMGESADRFEMEADGIAARTHPLSAR